MYIPVAKRQTTKATGYTPVAQRTPLESNSGLLTSFDYPQTSQSSSQFSGLGGSDPIQGAAKLAYSIPKFFVRSGLSTLLETPLGKKVGTINPEEDFGKLGAKLLGEEPIIPLSEKQREYTSSAESLGLGKLSPIVAGIATGGEVVLDLWFG